MARAIAPKEIPALPVGASLWRKSLRIGGVFHAIDALGTSVCRQITLERNESRSPDSLGDIQYWGCCPRCMAKARAND